MKGIPIKEEISKAEKRFDFYRKTVSLFLGPFVFLALLITPVPELSAEAHRLCAIMGLVLIFWVGEPIPIPATALLGPALCVIFAVAKSSVVFAPFSNPIIFLFIGSFMLAEAMKTHHLDRRLALTILSLPMVGNNLYCVMFAVAIIPLVLSMWISDSAATAMMYPIMLGVLSTIDRLGNSTEAPNGLIDPQTATKKRKFGAGALLTIAYAAVIGGIGTPIGTPPNLIGIAMVNKMIGVNISFFSWMSLAVPIMIVMAFFMLLYMSFVFPPLSSEIKGLSQVILKEKSALGSWTRGQKNTLAAFFFAIVLWILPGISAAILGTGSEVYKFLDTHIHEEIVSLIAALGLFFAPVNWSERKFTITWAEAVKIDWGTILLFGGGLSLGTLMFSTNWLTSSEARLSS